MRIPIFQITVNAGRREVDPEAVQGLADSISKVGLLNPITVDQDYTLIAGLHRLEAAKLLGWSEIECTVSDLEGLLAELAEIDENLIRRKLDCIAQGEQLNRRKEIYEALHPETKAGISQAAGMNRAMGNNVSELSSVTSKSFSCDTADKLGVAPRTVEQKIQIAKNVTPEAKKIIRDRGVKIPKNDALKLSRLPPEQQEEVVNQLAAKAIRSVNEYHPAPAEPEAKEEPEQEPKAPLDAEPAPPPEVPASPPPEVGYYATTKDSVNDLKNPNKDRRRTPDTFLATLSFFLQKFCQSLNGYAGDEYESVIQELTREHLNQLHEEISSVHTLLDNLYTKLERMAQT